MNKSILKLLEPWMIKPLEFIFHAEIHYRNSSDYNKRMAFINFDNAIEVSIFTFMHINKEPKGLKLYNDTDLKKAEKYFPKLEKFEEYVQSKNLKIKWNKQKINYYHEQRNRLYHDASLSTPDLSELNEIREITLWIFSVLFEIVKIDDILNSCIKEAELEFPQIPEAYPKPIISDMDQEHETSFFVALILGGWYENSQGDNNIISNMAQMDSNKWINDVREINKNNPEIFSLNNGYWEVKEKIGNLIKYVTFFYDSHLDLIKDISLNILLEIKPRFNSKPEDIFVSPINKKYPQYSSELRKGISETLVFLSIHGKELMNCSLYKPEDIVSLTIRELFNNADWKLWASLNDILSIIAEADPDEFLSSVEKTLKRSPCSFDELFAQENNDFMKANYINGLYCALEIIAWSKEHLSKTILILAELATHESNEKGANRPISSIIKILLPWFPKTTAPIENRIASLKGIKRYFPEVAWKVLLKLLPRYHQTSSMSHKPLFRNYIPTDWKNEVLQDEYWEQINEYAALAIDMTKSDIHHASELVDILDNIPQPSFDAFLEYLSSDEIVRLPDDQKNPIWEKMISLIRKHRYYSSSKWALSVEEVELLEHTAQKIAPLSPELFFRHLFSSKYFDIEDKDKDIQTHRGKVLNQRIKALKEIYKINKIDSIIIFSNNVENPAIVGDTFAHIANGENDLELLPFLLNFQEEYKRNFICGYIWARYCNGGIGWIENLHTVTWSTEQKCNLLLNLPFENEIWKKASEILGEHIGDYWKKINVHLFPSDKIMISAIENLLKYNRPRFAFSCIYAHYYSQKELFKEQAIKALINGISSDEPIGEMDSYEIIEIITVLQDDPNVNEDDLFKIEWGYLQLLDRYNGAEPKLLEKYLAQKPDFFVEVIQLVYRSNRDDESDEKADERAKGFVDNAWELLDNWKRPPGKMDDGSFSGEILKKWIDDVKIKTIESGHFEIAMMCLGHVLLYAGADPSGLWIQKPAAEILDDNDDVRQGFKLEVYNSRGAHVIDESGKNEKELADFWRKNAEEVEKLGLIRFSSSLKDLAHSYDREAERIISMHSTKLKNESNEDKAKNDL